MKSIKLPIVKVSDRTDVLCVICGMFRADHSFHYNPDFGLHMSCLKDERRAEKGEDDVET